jgi:hypothetical protein
MLAGAGANASKAQYALAYNLGNFLRTLATPEPIGAKVISHGRSIAFQMAEVAIPRQLLQEILGLIAELRPKPLPVSMRLPMVMRSTAPDGKNYAQMPRKNRQFGPTTSARGPNGLRPATDRAGPYGKPGKSLRSASNSSFIRGIPDQTITPMADTSSRLVRWEHKHVLKASGEANIPCHAKSRRKRIAGGAAL